MLYGDETKKALKNFPFRARVVHPAFIEALVIIKKAVAKANRTAGVLDATTANAIVHACDEVLSGKYSDAFPLSSLQGGAGTACNMNVNEVIATLATQKAKKPIHPIDHVNAGQSTNDVNPSALKIAAHTLLSEVEIVVNTLASSFEEKGRLFASVSKLGRTHLQDAVPTTLGAECTAYASVLFQHTAHIARAKKICTTLSLGGTAIGNSINAHPIYMREVYPALRAETHVPYKKASNLMAKTGSQTDFLIIAHTLLALCVDASKIASDMRLLASGPFGGFGEVVLPELQKGSSIMPGKINPVLPEAVNQLYFLVSGNTVAIEHAASHAQLELGVMLPTIVEKLLESLELTIDVLREFNGCVRGMQAQKDRCALNLETSLAYATLLVPRLGYDTVALAVKQAMQQKKTIREIVIAERLLSELEFNALTQKRLKK